jgi:16S rRNA (cytosine967-C5)-methyltransferase
VPAPEKRGRKSKRHGPPAVSADARALALDILQRVEAGAYADALLGHRLDDSSLSSRDQALVTRLVYGTLAWQAYLDHILAAFSRRPPRELDPPVRAVLRLALFQMCRLTRIPDFAVVDTAVRLAKRFRGGAAVNLVNAVLRRAAAGWRDVTFPSRDDDPIGHLATGLSHPPWLVERWLVQFGFDETAALLGANNEPAPTVLRVNRRHIDRAQLLARVHEGGWTAAATLYSPAGICLEGGGALRALPGYAEGWYALQGEASQLVGLLVDPQPGERVLDACAAPGGKATHLAELMNDQGELVALDIHERGVQRVNHLARRLRLSIVKPIAADALTWTAKVGFDRVLVDAPCSGFGTLRQHPEVKWRRTPADIEALARLQTQLLLHLADLVRPGGILVYATCTISVPENENVVGAFLQQQHAFTVDEAQAVLPDHARTLVGSDGALRTLPHRHGLDGFFAVRLKRCA